MEQITIFRDMLLSIGVEDNSLKVDDFKSSLTDLDKDISTI